MGGFFPPKSLHGGGFLPSNGFQSQARGHAQKCHHCTSRSIVQLSVCAQLDPIVSGKDPSVLSDAMPVVAEEPVACFAGMALARPAHEPLLYEIIVSAHGCGWNDTIVIGSPSHDQRIELRNDPCLWSCLQLLQPLLNGSQVTLDSFCTRSDTDLERGLLPAGVPGG